MSQKAPRFGPQSRSKNKYHWILSVWNIVARPQVYVLMGIFGFIVMSENQSPAYYLAEAMYYETWNEDITGNSQKAIAGMIFNRLKDPNFPKHLEYVVKQPGQGESKCSFAYRCDGYPDNPWLEKPQNLPRWVFIRVMAHWYFFQNHYLNSFNDPTGGALYYKHKAISSVWFDRRLRDRDLYRVEGDFGSLEFFWTYN